MDKGRIKLLLLDSIDKVFSTSFYTVVEPMVDEPPQSVEPEGGRIFHSRVCLKKRGTDRFGFDFYFVPSFLQRVTRDFLGLSDEERPSDEDMLDMAREIANMVVGEVASMITLEEEGWDMGLPTSDVLERSVPVGSGVCMGFTDLEGGVFHVVVEVLYGG